MDDERRQSIFAVLLWDSPAPCLFSILQLETQEHNHEYAAHLTPKQRSRIKRRPSFSSFETQLNQKEYVAHFNPPQGNMWTRWVFSPLTSSTSIEELYMVPFYADIDHFDDFDKVPLHGCIFNFRTKTCRPISHPIAPKFGGHIVSVGGCIYFIAQPCRCAYSSFECYDPVSGLWKTLKPFPAHDTFQLGSKGSIGYIVATAVWDNTILFNLGHCEIWAYSILSDKWCPVKVEDGWWCYSIEGEAVVLENTIYALTTRSFGLVLALSIQREEINGDLGFKCSIRSKIFVPDMKPISFEDVAAVCRRSRHLVHLGKDNFCLVQSCYLDGSYDYQPIKFTHIKLKEENSEDSMTVTDECVHLVRILEDEHFNFMFCFSVPECKTTALKECKNFVFDLDPFPEDFDLKQKYRTDFNSDSEEEIETPSKYGPLLNVLATSELDNDSSQTNIIDEQGSVIQSSQSRDHANTTLEVQEDVPKKSYASVVAAKSNVASKASTTLGDGAAFERSNTDEEGHSIYVKDLSPDATFRQLEKELKKFGLFKRDGIQVGKNEKGKCFAYVEFESATSKQRAIKASAIIIGGCRAEIEEKRRRGGLTLVDSSRTSGSSSIVLKNHGKVSRSKTTCGGHNVGEGGGYQPRRRPKGVWY